MNKETNKLLADFLEEKLTWNDLHDDWMLYEYDGKPFLWNPHSDWNQLMQVVDKLKFIYSPISLDELHFLAIQEVFSTTIGNNITWIYNKVVNAVKLLMNDSRINPE